MLVVVHKGKEKIVEDIFEKWDLHAVQIGVVTEGDALRYYANDKLVAEVPASELVLGGGAPVYDREYTEPAYYNKTKEFNIDSIETPKDIVATAKELLTNVNLASKKWVTEQYDSMVGTKSMSTNAPSDAGIVDVRGSEMALALTVDCNSKYVFADPNIGTQIAVSEAARNIVCSGGKPSAITNCLNFGNPYNPEVYWQFVGAIKGMSEACTKFQTPVTGGNVSFYNHTVGKNSEEPVMPTPTIGMLGLILDKNKTMSMDFKKAGDKIFMLGQNRNDINSSEYLVSVHGVKLSPPPHFNLEEEHALQQTVSDLIDISAIASAHDVADGGLFITLTESGYNRELGFNIAYDDKVRMDAFLFGESQSRVVVSVSADQEEKFLGIVSQSDFEFQLLGEVTSGEVKVDEISFGSIKELKSLSHNALGNIMNK